MSERYWDSERGQWVYANDHVAYDALYVIEDTLAACEDLWYWGQAQEVMSALKEAGFKFVRLNDE